MERDEGEERGTKIAREETWKERWEKERKVVMGKKNGGDREGRREREECRRGGERDQKREGGVE